MSVNRWRPAIGALITAVAVLATGGVARAAAAAEPGSGTVIAKAGSIELSERDVRHLVASLPGSAKTAVLADPAALPQLVRQELVRRLVLEEAHAKAFERDPAVLAELDRLRDEAVLKLWVERQAKPAEAFPSEDDLKRAYEAARQRASGTSEYRLSQVFIAAADGSAPERIAAALRKAAEVQAKLAGGDFAATARAASEHADSAGKGGDLGFQPESRLLPEVRAVLATLKVGEVAGPIKTAQGLHFVKLMEKKAAPVPPLDEVHDALATALRQQRSAELQQHYLAEIAAKAPPSVNEVELGKLKATFK